MQKFLLPLSLLTAFTLPSAAWAQMACGDRERIVGQLAKKYGETPQSIGLGRNQGVVETFASDKTGTWTIILTTPEGRSCLLAAGEGFEALEPKAPDQSDPT